MRPILVGLMVLSFMFGNSNLLGAAEDQPSLGTKAGESARELKDQASQSYAAASNTVAETSKKVEAEAQDAFKNLQQQWEAFSKRLQTSTQQLSEQVKKQWDDFNKSFNQPQKK